MFVHDDSLKFPKMRQQNLETGRVYAVAEGPHKGKVYPSITRILKHYPKPELEAWKQRVGKAEAEMQRERGARRGASIHKLCESFLGNDEVMPAFDPIVGEMWSHLKPTLIQHVSTVYAQEQDVYSDILGVAGRMDLLAEWDGVLSIVDLKNSKKPKKKDSNVLLDYFTQCTFYALAVYERTQKKVRQIVLPVVYPGGIQILTESIGPYYTRLTEKIDYFYATYDKSLDSKAEVC